MALPEASNPAFGTVGNVLISDRAFLGGLDAEIDLVWIGFDSSEAWEHLRDLRERLDSNFWICGRVVPDANQPCGFYFDPVTTTAAEVVAELLQMPLDLIKNLPSSGRCPTRCCIAAEVEQLVSSG